MASRPGDRLDPATTLNVHRPRKRVAILLTVLVLLICSVLTGVLWREAHRQTVGERTAAAIKEADAVGLLVRGRLSAYELILHGSAALRASVGQIQQQQWSTYVRALAIEERYPGVVGVGLALYFDQSRLIRMQEQVRRDTGLLYEVWPAGVRAEYGPIVFLAPETPLNARANGFDMYAEPIRHDAMQRSMESGKAWITSKLQLKQDGDVPVSAAIMYLPIYRNNALPETLSARRAEMLGWSYIPFHTQVMVREALKPLNRLFLLRVEEVGQGAPSELYRDPEIAKDAVPVWVSEDAIFGRTWRSSLYARKNDAVMFTPDVLVLVVGIPLSLALSAIILLLGLTRSRAYDIAHQMTAANRRSVTLLRSTLIHSAIGKSLLDREGRILQVNPAFCSVLRGNEADFLGQKFEHLFDRGPAATTIEQDADGARREVRRLMRHDGEIRHIALTFSQIPPEEGLEVTQIVQVQDISDRISNEARIQALNRTLESRVEARTRELTEANDELKNFAYTVSHDLRAPLRAIEGFSQILIDKHASQLDEAGRGYLNRVRTAALRMAELIEAMLRLARLSQARLERRPIDLSDMAREIQMGLESGQSGRKVRFDIAPGLVANGDPALVTNLMQNLLGNAWKFTRGTEEAVIRVGRSNELPGGFFVEDNGAGFSEEFAHKLFLPFQRLHLSDEFEGDGIGLTSAKRVVERHGGEIRASGAPGQGARFVFNLPPEPEG